MKAVIKDVGAGALSGCRGTQRPLRLPKCSGTYINSRGFPPDDRMSVDGYTHLYSSSYPHVMVRFTYNDSPEYRTRGGLTEFHRTGSGIILIKEQMASYMLAQNLLISL